MPHSARWEVVTEGGGGCEGASPRAIWAGIEHDLRSPAEITDVSVHMGKDTVERPG